VSPNPSTVPVTIVGAGPVGLALAVELGRRGIRCTVVEQRARLSRIPKGQNLTQRTMEHFRRWGAEDRLRAARPTGPDQPAAGLVTYGSLGSGHHYPWMQRARVGSFYAAANERLPQYETERVLRELVAELPAVSLRTGWRARAVRDRGDGAEVEIVADGGAVETLASDWVVGCDGSHSRIRELAGISQTASDHERRMALVVFRSPDLDAIVAGLPPASFINVLHPDLDGYWQFFGRVDGSGRWFFHAPVDPGATVETLDVAATLTRAAGRPFDFAVEHVGFWDLRFALADAYRAGRVFIAGDAAHSHPPYGGYGINTGFEDAVNLGWKLAAVIGGWAPASLLDSYDAERRPVFASLRDEFIARAIETDRLFLNTFDPDADPDAFAVAWSERAAAAATEVQRYEPQYEGSPIATGSRGASPGALGDHRTEARPGHHLSPGTDVAGRPVFDLLAPGFTLLASAGAEVSSFEDAAAARGVPLQVVRLAADSVEDYGKAAILVRPDQFVAWAGDPRELSATEVLGTAIGAASRSHPG